MAEDVREDGTGLRPDERPRLYANHLEVTFSLSEVELCFAQAFDAEGRAEPQCRLRTTPVHLVGFGRAIDRTIAHYERRYGQIPGAAPDAPPAAS